MGIGGGLLGPLRVQRCGLFAPLDDAFQGGSAARGVAPLAQLVSVLATRAGELLLLFTDGECQACDEAVVGARLAAVDALLGMLVEVTEVSGAIALQVGELGLMLADLPRALREHPRMALLMALEDLVRALEKS